MVQGHFTSVLWSTHYDVCFTVANLYLASHVEITVALRRPLPLQGDISGINT